MRTTPTILIALLAAMMTAPFAYGQSQTAELDRLRADNAALRERVAELEAALFGVRSTLSELLRSIALDQTSRVPQRAFAPGTSDPTSSPDALLAMLRDRFARELPTDGRTPGAVRAWCEQHNAKSLGRVTWLIKPATDSPAARSPGHTWVRVYDELTGRPMGSPAEVPLPARLVRTLNTDPNRPWLLEAELAPNATFNANRPTPGVFNYPVLIGPYAEFGLALQRPELRPAPEGTADLIDNATAPMPASDPGR